MWNKGNFFTAAFLISGTSIGSAFVSAPIMTGVAGFFPGLIMSILIWILSVSLGLLAAEATLANPDGANVITITRNLIGKPWMVLFGVLFLFINMLGVVGFYILGATKVFWISEFFFQTTLPSFLPALVIALFFGFVLFLGVFVSDMVNFVLMLGFFAALFFVAIEGSEFVSFESLLKENWVWGVFALPILYNTMSFVAIVPSLCTYLDRDPKKIKKMILFGSLLSLFSILLWQFIVIGTNSSGELWFHFEAGNEIYRPISWAHESFVITAIFNLIILLCALTCLIGFNIAMVDMVSDGFHISPEKRKGVKRLLATIAVFLPPLFIYYAFPRIYEGIAIQKFLAPIAMIIMTAVVPLWWVIKARYYYKVAAPRFLPGGKWAFGTIIIAIVVLSYLEGAEYAG